MGFTLDGAVQELKSNCPQMYEPVSTASKDTDECDR